MQKYISRAQHPNTTKITCVAYEDNKFGVIMMLFMNFWAVCRKDDFLKKWRPAICEERPTA